MASDLTMLCSSIIDKTYSTERKSGFQVEKWNLPDSGVVVGVGNVSATFMYARLNVSTPRSRY